MSKLIFKKPGLGALVRNKTVRQQRQKANRIPVNGILVYKASVRDFVPVAE